ncbi:hypothetical protein DL98DRAFT_536296 [Cadophora sp. DSE1049]|nr:hypothetical protein DL98DRAFT_536296 [Cadophora sp. DSE1049]
MDSTVNFVVGAAVLVLTFLWHHVFSQIRASSTVNIPPIVHPTANLALTLFSYLPDLNQELSVQTFSGLTSFRFGALPLDLRVMIWRMTMPRGRRFPLASFHRNRPDFLGPRPPITYNICQESHQETLRHFVFLKWTIHYVQRNPLTNAIVSSPPMRTMQLLFDPVSDVVSSKLWDFIDPRHMVDQGFYLWRPLEDSFRFVRTIEILRVRWCGSYTQGLNGVYVFLRCPGLREIRIVRPAKLFAPGITCLSCFADTRNCKDNLVAMLLAMQAWRDAWRPSVLPRVNIFDDFEPSRALPAPAVDNWLPGEE